MEERSKWEKGWTPHKERTPRQFVRDLCLEHQTDNTILIVVSQTRWEKHKEEIRDLLKRRGDRWRKKGAGKLKLPKKKGLVTHV